MRYLILAVLLVGCTATNPNWTKPLPGQPNTNTVPQFVPDPRIHAASNTIIMGLDATAPINPYAGIVRPIAEGLLGAFGLISAYMARKKSGALDAMGAGVVKAGAGQAVIAHSTNTEHFADIASAVNNATGANQDNVGAPKS